MPEMFDGNQEEKLQFLADMRAVLHFPFFANTFSLAYHYANVLHRSHLTASWLETRKDLREHNWEDPIPVGLDPERANVFYATTKAIEDFEKTKEFATWHFASVPFTRYKPLWLFTDYRAFLDPHDSQKDRDFDEVIAEHIIGQGVTRIELFTDIPSQCEVLCKHLGKWGLEEKILSVFQPVDALRAIKPSETILRMYFYGAPATTKMREEPMSYIPFGIPKKTEWEGKANITQSCLALPKSKWSKPESELIFSEFKAIMKDYHREVFKIAGQDYTALINVWWAYNRYAERKKISSAFKSLEVFAKCLVDHHQKVK
jgi:hypothetical protein